LIVPVQFFLQKKLYRYDQLIYYRATMSKSKKIAIIGSGIAGLAAAIRLAQKGHQVDVYEKNDYPGGKLSHFDLNGFSFDAGPSLFTQPENIIDLFRICGESIDDYFHYTPVNTACTYFFESGIVVKAYVDNQLFAAELAEKVGEDADKVLAYLRTSRSAYTNIGELFLHHSLHKLKTFFHPAVWRALGSTKLSYLFSSIHHYNSKAFDRPETVQIFDRFATYNGSNPYTAPAMLTMIPHLEQNEGTFYPFGGMISISQALYQLALKMGATFHFSTEVTAILTAENNVKGITVNDSDMQYDTVVSNMDVYYTYKNLLKDSKKAANITKQERSSSAVIFYWGIDKTFPHLDLHNIFFSENYTAEFDHIFSKKTMYHDPTIYINITSKMEPSQAPVNAENWFVMVNAPHDVGQDWDAFRAACKKNIIGKLSKILQLDIEKHIIAENYLDPKLIDTRTSSYTGSLYGTSSNSKFAAFLRHPNFSNATKDLYFAGGSVHPGGGIPLCLKSAKIVSELIETASE